ncbi:class I SAM-dependent methyltransferase [Aquicella lusitana]|uniref:Methyltransferase family protein n=1 Tax=Aquicella lusitana TaxID=254246 RepID=A0A370H269_9COXI|nr:class I SAM-dependent methyltransferase [Aquicella lusitana]RDI48163.1 methyltransferase family protein [Aquicella lusitana]VVC72821.1 Trans-aconitate 2-methyltransferase [Aquicella lusitana]
MDSNLINSDVTCHICYAKQLNLLPSYPSLPRVASDCVPWRSGGKLAVCPACSCVQNPVDKHWHTETAEIYSRYKIYRQSAGSEQGVLCENKQLMPRSAKIFKQAAPFFDLKKTGRLLDIGCANGELLRCFAALAPHWKMVGFEIDDKCRQEVESIPGVEAFASGSLDKLDKPFDLITLMHVLEHLPDPKQWLKDLHRLLNPDGLVLIQVPDPKKNPYNLLVADHCSHFIMSDLVSIAQQAGYEVVAQSESWVLREFTLLIRPLPSRGTESSSSENQAGALKQLADDKVATYPANAVQWLHDIVRLVKSFPNDKPRGIWGTAIAATWLYSLMDHEVDFFVDEDASRIGQQHLGKPIYHPDTAPKNSNVFIALTPEIAANIVSRWSHLNVTLHSPPNLIY